MKSMTYLYLCTKATGRRLSEEPLLGRCESDNVDGVGGVGFQQPRILQHYQVRIALLAPDKRVQGCRR